MGSVTKFSIPTIDLTEYLRDPDSGAADAVIDEIRDACSTSGFFKLVGHGISGNLQAQALQAARDFFRLSDDEKRNLRGNPGRGYELLGTQTIEPGKQPDLKEGYFIGSESQREPPYRPFKEPNIWPSVKQIPNEQFKQPLLEYYGAVLKLALSLMHVLAKGMKGLDTSSINAFCQDPIASVRLLHYPPHPETADDTLVGTGAHTDFGAITLLLQDGNSGLQVMDHASNTWFDVAPSKDAYVVNIGDMLEVWTGGAYKSTLHRVINTSKTDRYSIPFFLDGNGDCVIKSLAPNGGGKTFTVEEHMLSRYAASYN